MHQTVNLLLQTVCQIQRRAVVRTLGGPWVLCFKTVRFLKIYYTLEYVKMPKGFFVLCKKNMRRSMAVIDSLAPYLGSCAELGKRGPFWEPISNLKIP